MHSRRIARTKAEELKKSTRTTTYSTPSLSGTRIVELARQASRHQKVATIRAGDRGVAEPKSMKD